MTSSLDLYCTGKLDGLAAGDLKRQPVVTRRTGGARVLRAAETYISFSCNDYLGLSQHPQVIAAAQEAIVGHGAGAGASRLITGNHKLFDELEIRLAHLKETEDCLVFGSGYLANIGLIPALAREGDLILVDELAHACIHGGCRLSDARTVRFAHNDMDRLAGLLEERRGGHDKCLIVTDGVFSMDGDLAPLPEMRELADRHDAWLVTDDAHGIGVVGGGQGSGHAFDPPVMADIQMGTLSKAVGSYGGYVCASHVVCDYLRNRARSFVFSTGLPPSAAAAAIAALEIIANDIARDKELVNRPLKKAALFCERAGLPAPASPIVPVLTGDVQAALDISERLKTQGFLVVAIRPPTVPAGTSRLRVALSAVHDDKDIIRLAELVKQEPRAIA